MGYTVGGLAEVTTAATEFLGWDLGMWILYAIGIVVMFVVIGAVVKFLFWLLTVP